MRAAKRFLLATQALILPGVASNYISTPDSAACSVTGDIDFRIRLAVPLWSPGSAKTIFSKWTSGLSYRLDLNAGASMTLFTSSDGAGSAGAGSAAIPFGNGQPGWIRITRVSSSGVIVFYTAKDQLSVPTDWSILNTTANTAGAIFDGGGVLEIGSVFTGGFNNLAGTIFYFEIRNGINGPVVVKLDPREAHGKALSFTSSTGEVWTLNPSGGFTPVITTARYAA